jgi:glyoxylase-like metal-dependent hydrolase (beta-lactamase superfamily II)
VNDTAAASARVAPGIHRLALPTPFLVGRVNCYLIEGEPLTLVDTGPNSGKTLDELEQGLAALGRRVEDLERIVITHQHIDHLGLLEILTRRSGAEVCALACLAPYLGHWRENATADDEYASEVMRRHGVPEDLSSVLAAVGAAFRAFGSPGVVTRALGDGDELRIGEWRFTVLHRPGHSPSDTVFWDAERQLLIGGDHLLPHISSNPLVSRPLDGSPPDPCGALVGYVASMRATRELPAALVLPGHGDPITDHVRLIDERLRMHERRAEKILRLLEGEPQSAFEIANRMWGNVAVTQAFLTISEVLGHLGLLLAADRVFAEEQGAVVRFAARG